jgi:hypothetical protein
MCACRRTYNKERAPPYFIDTCSAGFGPSGLAYHQGRRLLLVISDEGQWASIDLSQVQVTGVTLHRPQWSSPGLNYAA